MIKDEALLSDGEYADLLRVACCGCLEAEETRQARSRLLEPHRPDLHLLAERNLSSESRAIRDADDFVQETFLKALRGLHAFEGATRPALRNWLSTILLRCIDDFRDACTRRRLLLGGVWSLNDPNGRAAFFLATATLPDSEQDHRETWEAINTVLSKLKETHRDVLERCYHEGLSYKDAAPYLGCKEAAVKQRCLRALHAVRQRLRKKGLFPD